jgi:hypothetical protein
VEREHPDKSWQAAAKATVMGIRRWSRWTYTVRTSAQCVVFKSDIEAEEVIMKLSRAHPYQTAASRFSRYMWIGKSAPTLKIHVFKFCSGPSPSLTFFVCNVWNLCFSVFRILYLWRIIQKHVYALTRVAMVACACIS